MKLRITKPNNTKESEQIDFGLKKDRMEAYYNVKRKLSEMENTVEAIPYWKSFLSVAGFMLMILLIIMIAFVTFTNYESLPRQMPLIYSQTSSTWMLSDKDVYIIIPVLLLIGLAIVTRLNSITYKFDRRLSIVINITLILTAILGFIAFIQLFSFVLIY